MTEEASSAQKALESEETRTEPTLAEKMFGGKIKPKAEEKPEDADAKAEDGPEALAKSQAPGGDDGEDISKGQKKTIKVRIQELAREKNDWQAKAEANAKETERLKAELRKIQGMDEKDKTPKDLHREVFIEEKLKENMRAIRTELNEYMSKHENPAMFETSYNYYMPVFSKSDPWTVEQISKFPEKIEMFDKFFQAMTAGAFSPQEWVNAPQPLKMQKIIDLRKMILEGSGPADAKKEEPAKKSIPDSVVPDLSQKRAEGQKPGNATFYKVFNKKR